MACFNNGLHFEEVKFLCFHNHTVIGISHSHNGYS